MKTIVLVAITIALVGCSIPRAPDTKQFYEREAETTRTCMASMNRLPPPSRLTVDPATGHSPLTAAAWCYSSQIRSVVSAMQYPHTGIVLSYADYLVRLTDARDKGVIDTSTALASYRQTTELFKQSIVDADQKNEAAARRELVDRFAVFGIAMANVAAEQERQRQANRPVTCVLTGIYRTTGVTCI